MPSSRALGSRPRVPQIQSYSRLVSPTAAGSRRLPSCKSLSRSRSSQRLEQAQAINTTQNGLGAALRVRHESEDISCLVAHTGNCADRSVGVAFRNDPAVGSTIAKHYLTPLLHPRQR